jgi:hypothetical protein
MAALTGKTIKSTYGDLTQVSNGNSGIDGTLRYVSSGLGTNSSLQLSTTAAKVNGDLTITGTTTVNSLTFSGGGGFLVAGNNLSDVASASTSRSNLGVAIGSNVQAYSADLTALASVSSSDSNFMVGSASGWVAESGATARTSLGLGSLATASTINNANWSGTDLAVANGGTGSSSASDARTALGVAVGSDVQAYDADLAAIAALAKTDSNFIVGNGSAWVAESGATARTSLGLGTMAVEATSAVPAMTYAGTQSLADNIIDQPKLQDYSETVNAIGGSGGGTQDFDLTAGNVASVTVDTNANTFTFSNPSASGTACTLTLIITNGASQTLNWPSSVDWAGGSAPTLTASGRDVLTFLTIDAGTIWYGFVGGLAFA